MNHIAYTDHLTPPNVAPAQAVVIDPISQDWTAQVYGGFLQIGNGVLRCDPNAPPASADSCSRMHSGLPTTQNNTNTNDTNRMVYADTDANPATYNSTSATITIPAGATVAYARLYWAATNGSYLTDNKGLVAAPGCSAEGSFSLPPAGADPMGTVRLTAGGVTTAVTGALQNQTANGQIQPKGGNDSHALYYSADADVTGLLASLPSGSAQQISVANLWTPQGIGCFGGWALQVVYDYGSFIPGNLDSTLKQVYQFGGHVRQFQGDSKVEVRLDGINPQGSGAKAGLVVFEGDASVGSEDVGYIDSSGDKQPFTNIRGDQSDFWVSHALGSVPYAPYSGPYFFNGSADVATGNLPLLTEADSWMALELSAGQDSYLFSAAMIQVPIAEVTIDKRAISGDDYQVLLPGQQPNYSISVYASGAVPLQNIRVTDALAANCVRTITGLTTGAGQTYTCTGPATTTPLTNTADVVAATASGYQVLDTDTTAVQIASLDLAKTSNQVDVAYGTPAQWTITVTNTGSAELRQVAVTDPLSPNCARTIPSIPAGGNVSYVCSSPNLTQGMTNTARASAIAGSPNQPPLTVQETNLANNSASVLVTGIGLTKTSSDLAAEPGDQVTFTFTIRNTMETVLDPVEVVDPQFPTCSRTGLGPIAPRASTSYDCAVTITEPITNTAQAFGSSPSGVTVNSSSSVRVETKQIELVKSATTTDTNGNSILDAGDQVAYSFLVTNSGSSTLTGITLTDPMLTGLSCPQTTLGAHTEMTCTAVSGGGLTDILPGLRNLYCPPNVILDPQGTLTCTAEYEVTQADLDAGTIINEATATAADQRGRISAPASDGWVVTAVRTPVLTMTGAPEPDIAASPGERITYTVTLTNDGNVTLDDVTVDPLVAGMEVSGCLPAPLAPGESRTCILSQVVTQAQMDAGEVPAAVAGVATVRGGDALDPAPSVDLTIPTEQRPAISLSKNADVTFVEHPGDEIEYTLLLRNTGNVTLTEVYLADDLADLAGLSCVQPLRLAPGQVMACTVMYTVSQEVFDSGMVTSISTVTAQAPGPVEVTDDARIDIPVRQDPVLAVTKQADRESLAYPGELLNYLFIVTNIGDTTLTNLNLDDPMPGLTTVACDRMTLAPGESSYCQAGYPVTQDDIDAGDLVNTVTVTAVSPDGALAEESWATSRVPVIQRPELRLIKAASTSRVTEPGQVIHYAFLALNTGNVTAHNVQITDDLPGLSEMTCTRSAPVSLAPGDLVVCEASYVTTPADFAAGQVVNTAAVTGDGPFGLAIPPASDTRTVIASPDAQLIVRKTADVMTVDEPGDLVNYTFQLRNVGGERLDQLVLSDELPGMGEIVCDGGPLTSLEPGQSAVCHSSYTVTAADMERGTIRNVAQVSAVSASGEPVSERSADATVAAVPHQEITLTKTADPQVVRQADTTVTYTFTLTNNGTQTVTNPTIRDDMPGLYDWQCPDAGTPLAPGASRVCTAKFDMTQARFEAGNVYNLATAYAFSRYGAPLATSAYNLLVVIPQPELGLTKTADLSSVHRVGEPITYTFTVTNTGNETVNAVRVVDPMLESIRCGAGLVSMAPGDVAVCTGVGRPDQAALDAGVVVNRAVAIGEAASGDVRNPADDVRAVAEVSVPVTALPDAALRVTAEPGEVLSGEPVQFVLELENTGNVSLTSVDWQFSLPVGTPVCQLAGPTARLSARAALVPPLAPGQTLRCTVTYVATPGDAAAGSVVLEAIASGTTTALDVGYGPVRGEAAVMVGLPVVPPVPPVPPTPPPDDPRPSDKPPRLPQTGGTPGTGTAIVAEWPPPAYLRRDEEE